MGFYKYQVNVRLDDVTFDILNRFERELKHRLKQNGDSNHEFITKSEVIRRAIVYAYFVGIKGKTVEEAVKLLEEGKII